jgi:hypothetical protein
MAVIGPVDFLALTFPTHHIDQDVVESVAAAVANGDARILDLLMIVQDPDGTKRVLDVDEGLDRHGLAPLLPEEGVLMSEEDVETAVSKLEPGQAAVLLVYEHLWAARVAGALSRAGGEVALHVRIPGDVVTAAVKADELTRLG